MKFKDYLREVSEIKCPICNKINMIRERDSRMRHVCQYCGKVMNESKKEPLYICMGRKCYWSGNEEGAIKKGGKLYCPVCGARVQKNPTATMNESFKIQIKGITHDWMDIDKAFPDEENRYKSKKEAEKRMNKVIKAGRGKGSIRIVKESINEGEFLGTKGWTDESIRKFEKTIGKKATEDGFFAACVTEMKGKDGWDEEKAKGFCAAVKDEAYKSTMWRGKGKTKKEKPKRKI